VEPLHGKTSSSDTEKFGPLIFELVTDFLSSLLLAQWLEFLDEVLDAGLWLFPLLFTPSTASENAKNEKLKNGVL